MRRRTLLALLPIVTAAALSTTGITVASGNEIDQSTKPLTIAVLADTPYGDDQRAQFPAMIDSVNADAKARLALHLGDLKSGSTPCTDEYIGWVTDQLQRLEDPLVYTPGDNEWTDCHRPAAGGFDPIERLDFIRAEYFPEPGIALGGRHKQLLTQADDPGFETYVENVAWYESRVAFGTVHVVGSNNGKAAWTVDDPTRREAERLARTDAALAWIDRIFDLAEQQDAAGVAVIMQADMWDAFSVANGLPLDGFTPIVERLAERARAFGKPVLVLQGDSHEYLVDNPFAAGDPVHGISEPVPNVTRIVAPGETATQWLRLTVNPASPAVFSWSITDVPT